MEVRGSVILSIDEFVKNKYTAQYETWKKKLSSETLNLLETAGSQKWYPVEAGVIDPTVELCNMFYPDAKQGAWESGRYSAEASLTGVFKVFVLISTPSFMIKRAARIMATFYSPTEIKVVESSPKSMKINLSKIPIKNELIEHRIGGWIEKALEICGCENLTVRITSSLSKGDDKTVYMINWS